ncbi:IS4 family transposase [Streptomyces sp. NTH33]|uniref:IS4 family transposase n=1 Tax=Streptomyces sp. NTH33 TaxID=1735453 RepID=UPI000DA95896|nr:IS4 family transposase [Streptomyces sp. NTH33]PZH09240.1 IS4 family transposase [Streptomyces sp. NTH33]
MPQGDGERRGVRPTDLVSLGALTTLVPRSVLDEAIAVTEAHEVRVRKLPAHVVVYLLMALCLYADDDYEEVAEKLTGMLSYLPGSRWQAPTRGAITQARQRLGPEPVKEVFAQVAVPAASADTLGAFLGRWRVMAIDGFVLDLPDTPANIEEFGKDSAGGDETIFPQARVVAISECASHAPIAADLAGCWASEQTIAFSLYEQLTPGMLLTADRGFYGFDAWRQARASGAELLWRISASLRLDHLKDLPDGSWLALITKPRLRMSRKEKLRAAARAGAELDPAEAIVVRVIDYTVPDRDGEEIHLLTSILDPSDATAHQLAACYGQRWEAETGIDQLKTHLRGPGKILRSRTPELVYQEIWAYLLTQWALCTLMCRAATNAGIDPDRVKFLGTVRIVRRSVTDRAAFSP